MCQFCEGATDDEVLFDMYGRILNFGWTIEYVQAATDKESWGYTVGLTGRLGHPELALSGRCPDHTAEIINAVGDEIRLGNVSSEEGLIRCGDEEYLLVDVHPRHYELGTFGMWEWYYDRLGWEPPEHRVLEIVAPGGKSVFSSEPAGDEA